MSKPSNFPHRLLLEIMMLRNSNNPDVFIDKLYEAIFGRFNREVKLWQQDSHFQSAIQELIVHFQKREEYEKCAKLKRLMEISL